MTLSGPFIDQDMNYVDINTAYHLTELCLYKTTDLQVNPPVTGAIVLAAVTYVATFPDLKFCRVRARGNYVYVLAVANIGVTDADIIVFYSLDAGVTWNYTVVVSDATVSFKSYTVTHKPLEITSWPNCNGGILTQTHVRTGDSVAGVCNPWALAARIYDHPTGMGTFLDWQTQAKDATTIHDYYASTSPHNVIVGTGNYLLGGNGAAGAAFLDDYFGVGGWTAQTFPLLDGNMPKDVNRVNVKFGAYHCTQFGDPGPFYFEGESWVFWHMPSVVLPTAFDIGKHDPLKVYVGTEDKIYKSSDGAQHFIEHITSDGANDIECHLAQPASDDEITFWSATTRELIRTNGGIIGGVFGGVIDVSVPNLPIPYRIASDPINGFPIYVLEHQGSNAYKLRYSSDGVNWSDVTIGGSTSMTGARSLKSYGVVAAPTQRRHIFLKVDGIFYSVDGTTFTDKKGAYPGYGVPVVANLW